MGKLVLDYAETEEILCRLSREIVAQQADIGEVGLVGIRHKGTQLARLIAQHIQKECGVELPVGLIDTTLYRDDVSVAARRPMLCPTQIPFPVSAKHIILVDDVLYTGRTIRAALDALMDLGRPQRIQLAVLVDRGHRELPIHADYIGQVIPTTRDEQVKVSIEEDGRVRVWLVQEVEQKAW